MKVKLLKNVMEDGKLKQTVRMNRQQSIAWFKSTIIEVSDSTGRKLIDRGDAELVTEAEESEVAQ